MSVNATIVAGPPHAGVEHVANRLAQRIGRQVCTDVDLHSMVLFNLALDADVVIATTERAHFVHELTGNHVIYVIRDIADIERELELAEYPSEEHAARVIRDCTGADSHVKRAFEELDLTVSLPRLLYAWWEWQKTEISFWYGSWEEREWDE